MKQQQQQRNNYNSKKRRKLSQYLHETESLDYVPSPIGPIITPIVSDHVKKILLDRLKIEIIDKFNFCLSNKVNLTTIDKNTKSKNQSSNRRRRSNVHHQEEEEEGKKKEIITTSIVESNQQKEENVGITCLKECILVGTNQCTRALEQEIVSTIEKPKKPSVLLLARDVRPPTMLAHIPLLCQRLNIPILLLPGKASSDIGQLLGIKSISVMLFFQNNPNFIHTKMTNNNKNSREETNFCKRYDSFVNFALSKVPSDSSLHI